MTEQTRRDVSERDECNFQDGRFATHTVEVQFRQGQHAWYRLCETHAKNAVTAPTRRGSQVISRRLVVGAQGETP